MLLNKNCESFIMDILSYFNDYDNISFPCGDETIINLLLWKYKYRKNLGDIFICSYYFCCIFIKKKTPVIACIFWFYSKSFSYVGYYCFWN